MREADRLPKSQIKEGGFYSIRAPQPTTPHSMVPRGERYNTCLPVRTPSTRIDFSFIRQKQAVVLTTGDLPDRQR